MTDIVERLRGTADGADEAGFRQAAEIAREAADEIERLRNTIKNCPPVSESEYVRRLENEIERLHAEIKKLKHELQFFGYST